MTCKIVYVYPASVSPHFTDLALRFIESYNMNPPGLPHETIVALNASKCSAEIECLFSSFPNVTFLERGNDGYDCGAYQEAAARFPADMAVFCGSSTYFKHAGWLRQLTQAFARHGAIVGTMGNKGNLATQIFPHVRTTGFVTSTDLMNRYPVRISRPEQRYGYEHGSNCYCNWLKRQGLQPWIVDARGRTYAEQDWDNIENGFHRGNQSNLLIGDRLSCPPYHPTC